MPFNAADFLFPADLHVSDAGLNSVLVVGGCATAAHAIHYRDSRPGVQIDHVMFNHVAELPPDPPRPASEYDLQVIELPLRVIIGDATFRFDRFQRPEVVAALLAHGRSACAAALEQATAYHRRFGVLTAVMTFATPQAPVVAALDRVGGVLDLRWLVTELNRELAALVSAMPGAYICDLDAIGSSMGKRFFHDEVMVFYGHSGHWRPIERDYDVAPWHNAPPAGRIEPLPLMTDVYESRSSELCDVLWAAWEQIVRVARRLDPVKLVVFDLDDTLWRGQLAEHYADAESRPVFHGWPTGVWEAIHHLRARGLLTAICSKNDPELVRRDWDRAVHAEWLSLEDFTFAEIGWGPKAEAVGRLIGRASLTAASVLLVDDNPVEREAVRAAHPGVRTLGGNPYVIRRVLLWSAETQTPTLTEESLNRDAMVRAQAGRDVAQAALSREEFLASLGCRVDVFEDFGPDDSRYVRAFELLNKTNQFNTTGVRWSAAELKSFLSEGGRLVTFDVSDRFTSYGQVGVLMLRNGLLEQFVMSCRVIGLDVELAVLADLPEVAEGRVEATDANAICRDVFLRAGFTNLGGGRFAREGGPAAAPAHVALSRAPAVELA